MKKIYVVRQWEPAENYMGTACCAFTNYDDAAKEMKKLNKEYSYGMVWYPNEKYINGVIGDDEWEDSYHYYDVDTLILHEKENKKD